MPVSWFVAVLVPPATTDLQLFAFCIGIVPFLSNVHHGKQLSRTSQVFRVCWRHLELHYLAAPPLKRDTSPPPHQLARLKPTQTELLA